MPKSADSETAMCSDTSATDQRSGAGLNLHCFSDNPAMDCRKASWVAWRFLRAISRSSLVRVGVWPTAEIAAASKSAPAIRALRDLLCIVILQRKLIQAPVETRARMVL